MTKSTKLIVQAKNERATKCFSSGSVREWDMNILHATIELPVVYMQQSHSKTQGSLTPTQEKLFSRQYGALKAVCTEEPPTLIS